MHRLSIIIIFALSSLSACSDRQTLEHPAEQIQPAKERVVPEFWPRLDIAVKADPAIEKRVEKILSELTLEQKVAQLIQPEIRDITVDDMRTYGFGSYLNGGGAFPNQNKHASVQDWVALADAMYMASIDDAIDGSTIPTMWGTDAVHGHNNVIGATLFPHNIGLGAARNPQLIEDIARATAKEVMATGIDWVFAPTVAVVRDDRWGRTYESYSEDPQIVHDYAAAIVKGLQGQPGVDLLSDDHVISTVKHFVGDGGTVGGDDQGDNVAAEEELFAIHAQGYVGGLEAGAQTVMASFNSWHGEKVHGSHYLLTQVLKERMGFDGFVVGDWNGHGQIRGCTNESCPQAINAGLDVFMVPTDAWKPLYENTIQQVKTGVIPMERINDAVRRVLRVKLRAGLFDKPRPAARKLSADTALIGAQQHRDLARDAVRQSLVLLKNKQQLLPLSPRLNLLVAGDGADNIGKQSGGWSITWQGTGNTNEDFPNGTSIYAGLKRQVEAAGGAIELSATGEFTQKPDVAIVVFGEEPYAEGHGDLDNMEYQRGRKTDLALLTKLKKAGIPVVSVFISGRPMWVNGELNQSDAFVAAWLPGTEGEGVADVLLRDANENVQFDFTGRLSFSWPYSATQAVINQDSYVAKSADYDSQDAELLQQWSVPNGSSANRRDDSLPLLPYGFGLRYGDINILPDNLPEESESGAAELRDYVMFSQGVRSGFHNVIGDSKGSKRVASSIESNAAVNIRTMDRNIQEDTVLLSFSGAEYGLFAIADNFVVDLRGYLEANSTLNVEWKVNKQPTDAVTFGMRCEEECGEGLDITARLRDEKSQSWHTLAVDLQCFQQQGMDLSRIASLLSVATAGEFVVQLGDARIVPNNVENADIQCVSEVTDGD
ncbi:glycoside hydrolase family 3 protein [Alteromonas flava]|uniref:glycoside hydrolase family 3 protein n=1 Tax=Alteromonas flava TaxID=2048003 RepID=UPI000C28806A|nr:glycoside hydrolase family 3 N-terminal domain-containing protein [Alteromonas flava]